MPTGCASITKLSFNSPGGRSGGTPATAHVCVPTAAPIRKALVFLGGHSVTGWNVFYCNADGSSVILRMLARGWHVICVDMPNYGIQDTQRVVVNGTPATMAQHHTWHIPYGLTPPFDGPPMLRLFLDHIIQTTTWALSNVCNTVCLAGVSGGGATANLLGAIDDRFRVVELMQFGNPTIGAGSVGDQESWTANDLMVAATNKTLAELAVITAAVTGRRTVLQTADSDEYLGDIHLNWESVVANWAPQILAEFGGVLTSYHRAGAHSIDATQAAWIESDLVAHG